MKIIDGKLKVEIEESIVRGIERDDFLALGQTIRWYLNCLYKNIPTSKRISYGIVYTVKILSEYIFGIIETHSLSPLDFGMKLYDLAVSDVGSLREVDNFKIRAVALGVLSLHGLGDYRPVLEYFKRSADSSYWNEREISSILFRKIVSKYPYDIKKYLLGLVVSDSPNLRRFVAETLRPVVENRWFFDEIDYPISIISHLFTEHHPYPRASVGNNLSDISKKLPELVFDLVAKLVALNNEDSYWIAYRACRNLVKKYPEEVMKLLGIGEYRYKSKVYRL